MANGVVFFGEDSLLDFDSLKASLKIGVNVSNQGKERFHSRLRLSSQAWSYECLFDSCCAMHWTAYWLAHSRVMYVFLTTPKHFSLTRGPTKWPHQFFCLDYVTHWPSAPNVPMSSNAVTAEGFLLNLFWKTLSISSCSLSGNNTACWQREFQKLKIQELVYDLTGVWWGRLGTPRVIFPGLISMNVTNDVCGLSGLLMVRGWGKRRRDGRTEAKRGDERGEEGWKETEGAKAGGKSERQRMRAETGRGGRTKARKEQEREEKQEVKMERRERVMW